MDVIVNVIHSTSILVSIVCLFSEFREHTTETERDLSPPCWFKLLGTAL